MAEQISAPHTPEEKPEHDGFVMPEVSLSIQRPLIAAIVVGMIFIAATSIWARPFLGVYACVGLLLGLINLWFVQREVSRVTAVDNPSKQLMAFSSLKRLAVISIIALVIGFLDRPDGSGVFLGLAVFQIIFLVNTSAPVLKGLRQHS